MLNNVRTVFGVIFLYQMQIEQFRNVKILTKQHNLNWSVLRVAGVVGEFDSKDSHYAIMSSSPFCLISCPKDGNGYLLYPAIPANGVLSRIQIKITIQKCTLYTVAVCVF